MSIEHLERELGRLYDKSREAEETRKQADKELREKLKEYEDQWRDLFIRSSVEARLSWCTYCGAVRDIDYLEDRYSLHSKSDNYGPYFPHTSTKYRVCSKCSPDLSSPQEAKKFGAMFEHEDVPDIPSDYKTIEELCRRLNIPEPIDLKKLKEQYERESSGN